MAVVVERPATALRRSQAAEILGGHPNTVMTWARKGWLKTVEMPNETRYTADSVEAFRKEIYGE